MKKFQNIFDMVPEVKQAIPAVRILKLAGEFLANLNTKIPTVLLMSLFPCKASADDCTEDSFGTYKNIYMNHSQGNASVWIRTCLDLSAAAINGACNFTIASKQVGQYKLAGCDCTTMMGERAGFATFSDVIIYGQGLTTQMVSCLENFFERHCDDGVNTNILSKVFLGIFLFCCVFACIGACMSAHASNQNASRVNNRWRNRLAPEAMPLTVAINQVGINAEQTRVVRNSISEDDLPKDNSYQSA